MDRSYQKRIPFLLTLSGAIGEFAILWQVDNGRFEVGAITIRGSVACDLNLCDSDVSNPIAFVSLVLSDVVGSTFLAYIGWTEVQMNLG